MKCRAEQKKFKKYMKSYNYPSPRKYEKRKNWIKPTRETYFVWQKGRMKYAHAIVQWVCLFSLHFFCKLYAILTIAQRITHIFAKQQIFHTLKCRKWTTKRALEEKKRFRGNINCGTKNKEIIFGYIVL